MIKENPLSTVTELQDADDMLNRAQTIKTTLSDPNSQEDALMAEDLVYDNLVCGYFR